MIARRTWSGGWYCEAYGDDYAVLFPGSHIETSRGRVELPADSGLGVLYLRLWADAQAVRLTGQGHSGTVGGDALLWDSRGGGWIGRGAAYGVSPCAFRPNGELVIADVSMGSQGIRQIAETEIVTGDQSYYDAALQVAEFTRLGLVYVGQGMSGGVVLISGAQRKRLADGACYFVRANRVGDQFAVAWWTRSGSGTDAHAVRFSLADLDQFPDDVPVTVPTPTQPTHPTLPKEPDVFSPPQDFVQHMQAAEPGLKASVQAIWSGLSPQERDNYDAKIEPDYSRLRKLLGHEASKQLYRALAKYVYAVNPPRQTIRIYTKPQTDTTFEVTLDNGQIVHAAEDIFGFLDATVRHWADVGTAFGTPNPGISVGNADWKTEPNNDDRYIVPPRTLLDGGGVIINPPPPPPDLEKRIAALEQIVKSQAAQIADLKNLAAAADVEARAAMRVADDARARVDVLNQTAARKGDPVEVKGVLSVPFVGSRTITSRGTL